MEKFNPNDGNGQSRDRDYLYVVVRGPEPQDVAILDSAEYARLEDNPPMVARILRNRLDQSGDLFVAGGIGCEQTALRAKQPRDNK